MALVNTLSNHEQVNVKRFLISLEFDLTLVRLDWPKMAQPVPGDIFGFYVVELSEVLTV